MATATRLPAETEPADHADEPVARFVFQDVSWADYEAVLRCVGDRQIRVTYDQGMLEIMSPSPPHEGNKKILAFVVETLIEELDLPAIAGGSTTFRREDLERGLEPDECYYLTSSTKLRDLAQLDLRVDPPPDLAIEVDISRSILNRLAIYAALGVPEVWKFRARKLRVLGLSEGTYRPVKQSRYFPRFALASLARWVQEGEVKNQTAWRRAFRTWVREEIAQPARPKQPRKKRD